jgi:hypothetical protein
LLKRPAVTEAVEAIGIFSVWTFEAEFQPGAVPLVPIASVWVEPVCVLKVCKPEPATPKGWAAEPSQYLITPLVELNHIFPLSAAINPVGSDALLERCKDLFADIVTNPKLVRFCEPISIPPVIVPPARGNFVASTAVAGGLLTNFVPSYVKRSPAAGEVKVTVFPDTFATVGLGYVPLKSPPAAPFGARESVKRASLPAATVPEAAPTFTVKTGVDVPDATLR